MNARVGIATSRVRVEVLLGDQHFVTQEAADEMAADAFSKGCIAGVERAVEVLREPVSQERAQLGDPAWLEKLFLSGGAA